MLGVALTRDLEVYQADEAERAVENIGTCGNLPGLKQ
jgi:hypothetical protein